jgi:hypothetical protein
LLEDNTIRLPLAMKTVHPGSDFACGTPSDGEEGQKRKTKADQQASATNPCIATTRCLGLLFLSALHPRASVMCPAGLLKRSERLPVFSMKPLNWLSRLVRIVHHRTDASRRGSGAAASGHNGCSSRSEITGRSVAGMSDRLGNVAFFRHPGLIHSARLCRLS